MEYFRYLEPWLASWNISLDSVHLLSNKTVKWSEIRENFRDLWRNDDWQIRLSWFLIVCTVVNFVFIGIAWKIYGETISNMFFNKSRSPLHQRSKTNVLSSSMEDLFVKKIQWQDIHRWRRRVLRTPRMKCLTQYVFFVRLQLWKRIVWTVYWLWKWTWGSDQHYEWVSVGNFQFERSE